MAIQAVRSAQAPPTKSLTTLKLPKLRLSKYNSPTKAGASGPAAAVSPKNGNSSAAAGLMSEFLSTSPSGNKTEVVQAGVLGSWGSKISPLSRKIYETAIDAPSSVTYKNGDAHVYGQRTWTPATKVGRLKGYNSCARVASAILNKAGVKVGMQNRVRTLESILQRKGWKNIKVDDIKKGDVVIWKTDKGANHIGFYAGHRLNIHRGFGKTTVDNFSLTGEPEFRALHRETEWGWKIRKVLRAPK